HSLLVFDVLGVSNFDRHQAPAEIPPDAPQPITDLFSIHRDLSKKNFLESYHDAVQAVDESLNMFNLGYLSIELRALAERLFWARNRKFWAICTTSLAIPMPCTSASTTMERSTSTP